LKGTRSVGEKKKGTKLDLLADGASSHLTGGDYRSTRNIGEDFKANCQMRVENGERKRAKEWRGKGESQNRVT